MSSSLAVESAIDVSGRCYIKIDSIHLCKTFSVFPCLEVKIDIINETVDNSQSHCSNDGDDPKNMAEDPGSREILESMQRGLRAVNLPFI